MAFLSKGQQKTENHTFGKAKYQLQNAVIQYVLHTVARNVGLALTLFFFKVAFQRSGKLLKYLENPVIL